MHAGHHQHFLGPLVPWATGVGDTNIQQIQYGPDMVARAREFLAAHATNSNPFLRLRCFLFAPPAAPAHP